MIEIKVNEYYGNPSYYSVMPQEIFDALELASLKGEEFATVNKNLFDKMPYYLYAFVYASILARPELQTYRNMKIRHNAVLIAS